MRRHNLLATSAGAAVTAVTFVVLSLVPLHAPGFKSFVFNLTGRWMFGNPLEQLKLLGGVPGGFVSGYLARDSLDSENPNTAIKIGFYGVGGGLCLAYVLTVLLTVAVYEKALVLAVVPMFVIVAPIYLFGGVIAGLIGNELRKN